MEYRLENLGRFFWKQYDTLSKRNIPRRLNNLMSSVQCMGGKEYKGISPEIDQIIDEFILKIVNELERIKYDTQIIDDSD